MSKIVVLTGSPRVHGNTNLMAPTFIDAAEKAGGSNLICKRALETRR